MTRDFDQAAWDDALAAHVASRAPEWLAEDLGHECDWTTLATVPAAATASLAVVARRDGVIAGLPAAAIVARAVDPALSFVAALAEGARVERGAAVATISGPTRSILTAERTVLNLLGRTCGVATGTARLVEAVAGTRCRVYDTRKTVPGWRLLDKSAVRVAMASTMRSSSRTTTGRHSPSGGSTPPARCAWRGSFSRPPCPLSG